MVALAPDKIVENYVQWLRSRITVKEVGGGCEITTPFLDRHNDYLQIYIVPRDNQLLLTDDGYILRDLAMSGCDLESPRRKRFLSTILNGFGVRLDGEQLVTEATENTLPQKKHRLIQAMLAVNDMFLTAKSHVASLFLEDVEKFLALSGVRFIPNVSFSGHSGFTHSFDFAIPPSTTQPERILRAINRPGRDSVTAFLFAWQDTRSTRTKGSAAYAILNDSDKALPGDVLSALEQYKVIAVPWSKRQDFVTQLAA